MCAKNYDAIRQQCWKEAKDCFATANIFEKRILKLRKLRRAIVFLGVIIPVVIGSIVIAFGADFDLLPYFIIGAAILGIIQIVLSVWAIIAKWDETFEYAIESTIANYDLADRYRKLAKNPPSEIDPFEKAFNLLEVENKSRTAQDNKQSINEKEKRYGMRATLREFQVKCSGCGEIPTSMKPTDCDICGNF